MGKKLLRLVRRLLALVPAALLLVLLGMLVLPLTEGADTTPVSGSADWMAALPDDTPLSALVIPGTHDSATQYVQLAYFSKCQALSVGQQLEAGFRYLDIRLGDAEKGGDYPRLMHGFTNCKTGIFGGTLTLDAVLADVVCHKPLIVVQVAFSAVPHVADGEHPVRRQRELEQAVCPVALVLLGRQVLQFASQRYLRRELVLGVGDVDVGVHGSAVPFDNGLIVLLVDVHQAELECLRELSRQREVEAAIVCFVAPLEELRAVAVGLCDEVFCIVELPVDSTDIGKIGFHVHAVASAEQPDTGAACFEQCRPDIFIKRFA